MTNNHKVKQAKEFQKVHQKLQEWTQSE